MATMTTLKRFPAQLFLLFTISLIGCSQAFWQGFAEGYSKTASGTGSKLMLFGGENHRTYLGCLSCGEYSTESIFNEYGTYGSKYSANSIWNEYGDFGSPYSNYSPWNPYASDPPVVVNKKGTYFGRFTVNKYHPDRTRIPELVQILDLHSE